MSKNGRPWDCFTGVGGRRKVLHLDGWGRIYSNFGVWIDKSGDTVLSVGDYQGDKMPEPGFFTLELFFKGVQEGFAVKRIEGFT